MRNRKYYNLRFIWKSDTHYLFIHENLTGDLYVNVLEEIINFLITISVETLVVESGKMILQQHYRIFCMWINQRVAIERQPGSSDFKRRTNFIVVSEIMDIERI